MSAPDHPQAAANAAQRARAMQHCKQAAVCDLIEPWSHGTILRASRYPSYYAYNLVRVERDPGLDVGEFIALADRALAGLAHRRIDFETIAPGDRLRDGFHAAGWRPVRLVWMRHEQPLGAAAAAIEVERAAYDEADDLRALWDREDNPDYEPDEHVAAARAVALARDPVVLIVREGGQPVGFAQVERSGARAEVSGVYVHPAHRGRGAGAALTRAAVEAAADAEEIWIAADSEGRPRRLYERLGFRDAWTVMEITRWPEL